MAGLQEFRSFMSPEEAKAVADNNRLALAEGFAAAAVRDGLDRLTPGAARAKTRLTWEERGAQMFGEALFREQVDAFLVRMVDLATQLGQVATTTELARAIFRVEPDVDMRSLAMRKRLHAAIGRCDRYVPAPPKLCEVTKVLSQNVWKREG